MQRLHHKIDRMIEHVDGRLNNITDMEAWSLVRRGLEIKMTFFLGHIDQAEHDRQMKEHNEGMSQGERAALARLRVKHAGAKERLRERLERLHDANEEIEPDDGSA